MSRLLWLLVTPRQLRRSSLAVLVVWTVVAFIHQNSPFDGEHRFNLPRQVPAYSSSIR